MRSSTPAGAAGSGDPEERDTPRSHLGRTAAWMAKQVELGLDGIGLSLPQYRILWLLDAGPTLSSTLADRLAVRPPSVTAVVDGLVGRGLVERHHSEDDRRRVSHTLTADGRELLAAADRAVDSRLADIAACLPSDRLARQAVDDVALWQQAMLAHRERVVAERLDDAARAAAARR